MGSTDESERVGSQADYLGNLGSSVLSWVFDIS